MEIEELYKNFILFIIELINDISIIMRNNKTTYYMKLVLLSQILFDENKKIFIGFLLILISFIFYFVDSTN
jgi:hypothetical protein